MREELRKEWEFKQKIIKEQLYISSNFKQLKIKTFLYTIFVSFFTILYENFKHIDLRLGSILPQSISFCDVIFGLDALHVKC